MVEVFKGQFSSEDNAAHVCVIGSGPAGTAVALSLAQQGLSVILLESGGPQASAETDDLLGISSGCHSHHGSDSAIRARVFGGTSSVWTGRVAPFHPMDLSARSWVPGSGWPFSLDELQPFMDRAADFLGVVPGGYAPYGWTSLNGPHPPIRFDESLIVDELYQFSREPGEDAPTNTARLLQRKAKSLSNLRIYLHATVTEILVDPENGRVRGVEVATLDGRRTTLNVPRVAVCAGGIENSRLLLYSRSVMPKGLGNDHDQVGRYFMDHPFATLGHFAPSHSEALRSRLGHYFFHGSKGMHVYVSGLTLSPRVQIEQQTLTATTYLISDWDADTSLKLSRLKAALGGREMVYDKVSQDVSDLLLDPRELVSQFHRRVVERRPMLMSKNALELIINPEQVPRADNRITLSDETDRLALPRAHIEWAQDDLELKTARVMADVLDNELTRVGLPRFARAAWLDDPDNWRASFFDAAHCLGGTRMADDPKRGVVDAWGAVHGVPGLWMAGGSTFPTSGNTNSTLMLTATSVRTADAIRRDVARSTRIEIVSESKVRVGVIGTGQRFQNIFRPLLRRLEDRFEIAAVFGRNEDRRQDAARALGTEPVADFEALKRSLDGRGFILAAVSPDANPTVAMQLAELGAPYLMETPPAWGFGQLRRLQLARPRDLPIGITEQFPWMPEIELVQRAARFGLLGRILTVANDGPHMSYHGMAITRRMLGPGAQPTRAQGSVQTLSAPNGDPVERLSGTVTFSDGSEIIHRFASADQLSGIVRELRVEGTLRRAVDDVVYEGRNEVARVIKENQNGATVSASLELDGQRLVWSVPTALRGLTEEHIASSYHLTAMREAVLRGGAPAYTLEEAMLDVELANAMKTSAARGGVPIPLPFRFVDAIAGSLQQKVKQRRRQDQRLA